MNNMEKKNQSRSFDVFFSLKKISRLTEKPKNKVFIIWGKTNMWHVPINHLFPKIL